MANASVVNPQQNNKKVCKFYNEGVCTNEGNDGIYKHVCNYCVKLGKNLTHQETKCVNKQRGYQVDLPQGHKLNADLTGGGGGVLYRDTCLGIDVTDKFNNNLDCCKFEPKVCLSCESKSNGICGSCTQIGACNSKYLNISVINSFRQLNNAEPFINRGTIRTAPLVNTNVNANGLSDIKVSDSFVSGYNMEVLTSCETLQVRLVQNHCCVYSHSVVHQVYVLDIDSIGKVIQCLYLHPALGDNVHWFYTWNVGDSRIFRIFDILSGNLKVLSHGTVNILSCVNVDNCLDSNTAKIDFDNEVKARVKYGTSQ